MLELRVTGLGEARLLEDGQEAGLARWSVHTLSWPGERVKLARVETFDVPPDLRADFWAYLAFLFQRDGAAAGELDGVLFWFSQALEKRWRAAGSPLDLAPAVQYRPLALQELDRTLFSHFIRRQEVHDCWRRAGEGWVIRPDPFVDDWSEEDYQVLLRCLRDTLRRGGLVHAAFVAGQLKGFVAVLPELFGGDNRYLDLASIHVSQDLRGQGIGAALFRTAADWARDHGGGKLYISSHSAVESQAFYEKMGCVDAQVPDPRHVEAEPFDRQLEFLL